MVIQINSTWFRIAANPKAIKEGSDHHWRCFIGTTGDDDCYTMKDYRAEGQLSSANFLPQSTVEEGVDPRAWILMFGDVKIVDGIGQFLLKEPPISPDIDL